MTAALAPGTTVCIPTWNGAAFLPETLAAVLRQAVPGMRVLVSVDGADAATAACCEPFLQDPRVTRLVQERRLGWVGNTNALIAAAETARIAIMPHDDLPEPDWLAALHAALDACPGAVGAYADLEGFGSQTITFAQPAILGPPLARRLKTLLRHYACVPYRGLFRLAPNRPRPLLPTGLPGDIAADTAWLMELACQGDLRRVPRMLVRKRYHAGNTHGGWLNLPPEAALATCIAVLRWMQDRAGQGCPGAAVSRRLVAAAALLRLLGCAAPWPFATRLPPRRLLAAWLGTDGLTGLLPSAQDVLGHPDAGPLRAALGEAACGERLADVRAMLAGSPWDGALRAVTALAADVRAASEA